VEFVLDYSGLVDLDPFESLLFAFLVERSSLSASGIDNRSSVDGSSLVVV
jgi:hypothetical protein